MSKSSVSSPRVFSAPSSISEAIALTTSRELEAARELIGRLEQKILRLERQIAVFGAQKGDLVGRDSCVGEVTRVTDSSVRFKMDSVVATEEFSVPREILIDQTLQAGDTVVIHSFIEREDRVCADTASPDELRELADALDEINPPRL